MNNFLCLLIPPHTPPSQIISKLQYFFICSCVLSCVIITNIFILVHRLQGLLWIWKCICSLNMHARATRIHFSLRPFWVMAAFVAISIFRDWVSKRFTSISCTGSCVLTHHYWRRCRKCFLSFWRHAGFCLLASWPEVSSHTYKIK